MCICTDYVKYITLSLLKIKNFIIIIIVVVVNCNYQNLQKGTTIPLVNLQIMVPSFEVNQIRINDSRSCCFKGTDECKRMSGCSGSFDVPCSERLLH